MSQHSPSITRSAAKRKAVETATQPPKKKVAVPDDVDRPVTRARTTKKPKEIIVLSDSNDDFDVDMQDASSENQSPEKPKVKIEPTASKIKLEPKVKVEPNPKVKLEPKVKSEVPNVQSSMIASSSIESALNLRIPNEKLKQWVDKHRPKDIKDIIGQHTEQAPAKKLMRWLKDWSRHNLGLAATKKKEVIGTGAKLDGSSFRAALLSGPPGIGKTTTAVMVCEALSLRYIELNASAARSKKMLEQKVAQLIHSRRIDEYFGDQPVGRKPKPVIKNKTGTKVTHVLIMDEVDGMSGNQDRAGVAELIKFIKKAEIPIICICNDRASTKIRSLANYCLDIRYTRPSVKLIVERMVAIARKEKLKITEEEIKEIVKSSNQDMRQSIYSLELLSAGQNHEGVIQAKDISINIFEAARQLITIGTSVREKRDLFFSDYSMMPLLVQENYLQVRSSTLGKKGQMRAFRDAADSMAMGEMVNKQIWSSQNWSLLPLQGMLSCVLPSMQLAGYLTGNIAFPVFLGRRSNQTKRIRLLRELDEHMGLKMSGPLHAISTDYIPVIRNAILRPLIRSGSSGVEEAIEVYHAYDLVKEDLESINELGMWNENDDLWKNVKPAVKASLTRTLGKDNHKKHYADLGDVKIEARTAMTKTGAKPKKKVVAKRPTAKDTKDSKAKAKEVAAKMEPKEESDEDLENAEADAEILGAY